jgi:hypothetical protein
MTIAEAVDALKAAGLTQFSVRCEEAVRVGIDTAYPHLVCYSVVSNGKMHWDDCLQGTLEGAVQKAIEAHRMVECGSELLRILRRLTLIACRRRDNPADDWQDFAGAKNGRQRSGVIPS